MTLKMNLRVSGLLTPSGRAGLRREFEQAQRAAVLEEMRAWAPGVVQAMKTDMSGAMKLRGSKALRTVRAKFYDKRPDKMPAVLLGSKIDWLGIHQEGGTVTPHGKGLLIPFGDRRVGEQSFKKMIRTLMSLHNAFFANVNGQVILFAERLGGADRALNNKALRRFRGSAQWKQKVDIPIAILIPQAQIRKRLHFDQVIEARLDALAGGIERRFRWSD